MRMVEGRKGGNEGDKIRGMTKREARKGRKQEGKKRRVKKHRRRVERRYQ